MKVALQRNGEFYMKVLLVNGSPNKNGCTVRALTEIKNTLKELGVDSEIYNITTEAIKGCSGCRACKKLGRCVIDDSVNEFIEKARDFDGFVFGSPVYYSAPNGTLVAFMDRVFYSDKSAAKNTFTHKPAASIASARRAGTTPTLDQINKYFAISSMPIITSTYWNEIHGNTAEEASLDLEGLRTMRNLARNMAWFLKIKKAGEEAGVTPPSFEYSPYTNFIR
jgi:multimeric flavodoxin WrbA